METLSAKLNINDIPEDLWRAWALLWRAGKGIAIVNIALQLLQAMLPVAALYFIKLLIEALSGGNRELSHIVTLITCFGMLQFLLAIAGQLATYVHTIHQQKLSDALSAEVLSKAISVDYSYYENPAYHDTLHLAQQQSLYRVATLLANFNTALLNSFSLVLLVGFFFTLSWLFALLFMAVSVPLAMIKWYSGNRLLRLERLLAPMEREAAYLYQSLIGVSSAKEVRVFGFGESFIRKFAGIRHAIHNQKRKLHLKLTWFSLLAEAMEVIAMVLIFLMLAKHAWQGAITVGVFVIYIQGFQRLQAATKNFLQSVVQIFQHRLFLKDLFAFFDIESEMPPQADPALSTGAEGLSVSNLSFTYPQTTRQVLFNVSVECRPGQIIAIVGENGSGKSTLVKLLARLYRVQQGQIKLDGNTLETIDPGHFRQGSVFLFQDFEKYFLTVEENIVLGDERQSRGPQAVAHAAALSGAHTFISKLSNEYQTRMGRLFEGSEQLSGGQWQKIALARVFYKQANLIVLDEPTSALDATAELEVFNNLKKELNNKVVVLITHRLYNLKMADHIYVMADGAIAEEGSFETLVNGNGRFKKMYDAQKL